MMYALNDLLIKMGAPEVKTRGRMEWHYFVSAGTARGFDKTQDALAGFAEVRLGAGGEHLIAELKHIKENYEDDHGKIHRTYTESFYLYAERLADQTHYRVTKISFDGDDYNDPAKGVVELGLSLFHARALDISIRMIEQTFNKQDITLPPDEKPLPLPAFSPRERESFGRESFGIVIPFRPRNVQDSGAVTF